MAEEYRFDAFDEGAEPIPGDAHIENFKRFISQYTAQVRDIETALEERATDLWDSDVEPIDLLADPVEDVSVLELVKGDNKILNKVVRVFVALQIEVELLKRKAETEFYPSLVIFGDPLRDEPAEGDVQLFAGRMLEFFYELSVYVTRAYSVLKNIVQQLGGLMNERWKLYDQSFRHVHFEAAFGSISELLGVFITLDTIISQNPAVTHAWTMFKRMTRTIRSEPARFGVQEAQVKLFERMLGSLEGQLFDGMLFQNAITQMFDAPGQVEVTTNRLLADEFILHLRQMYQSCFDVIGDVQLETTERQQIVGVFGLYVLYYHLYRDASDKKLFRALFETYKKLPLVHMVGNVIWMPADFLNRNLPALVKTLVKYDRDSIIRNALKENDATFEREIASLYGMTMVWAARMESNLSPKNDARDVLATRVALFAQGVHIACRISHTFRSTLFLHLSQRQSLRASHVRLFATCSELLKAIETTFFRRSTLVGECLSLAAQQVSGTIRNFVEVIKQRMATKRLSERMLDVLASLCLLADAVNGPPTDTRRAVALTALDIANQRTILKDTEFNELRVAIQRLHLIGMLHRLLHQMCDCSFLFWVRELCPMFFRDLYAVPEDANKLPHLLCAFGDAARLLTRTHRFAGGPVFEDAFRDEVMSALKENVTDRLCRDVENDLRVHIHTVVNSQTYLDERNPLKTHARDLGRFVTMRPIHVFDRVLNFKERVAHYLDTTFYNATCISQSDWKTYGEMRNLAREKYGITLTEVYLPSATLEQGLDVLEIMRNIHIFVSQYHYNMNEQVFVEKAVDTKYLNSINIRHIANSIRTHGAGIMNTTVNFTYQYLQQKFFIFSQFLYDDHIKSRLLTDIRFYKEKKEELQNRYPFERADKFNKDIRRLGVQEDGSTYLDHFRVLITEIGNAMGYVRMVRSGGMHFCSKAIQFVTDLSSVPKFAEPTATEKLPVETVEAAKNLDSVLENLQKNFAEGIGYFHLLVKVFSDVMRDENTNLHLRNFFIIVPALTLNFVEHMLTAKDRLNKKGARGAAFTDDGFVMGVAYILALLNQNKAFEGLHWFDSVNERYRAERMKIEGQLQAAERKKGGEEATTLTLTLRRHSMYQREFELLYYAFDSACSFFRNPE